MSSYQKIADTVAICRLYYFFGVFYSIFAMRKPIEPGFKIAPPSFLFMVTMSSEDGIIISVMLLLLSIEICILGLADHLLRPATSSKDSHQHIPV